MLLKQYLAVMLGGSAGAALRWALGGLNHGQALPVGTLAANLVGCFTAGLIMSLVRHDSLLYLFVVAGLCGALTTFSTFMVELLETKPLSLVLTYAVISVVGGLLAVWAGLRCARLVA